MGIAINTDNRVMIYFIQFTLTSNALVSISHCGTGIDTYMHLLDAQWESDRLSMTTTARYAAALTASIQTNLTPGIYYVVSEGYGTNTGNISTEIYATSVNPIPSGAHLYSASDLGTLSTANVLSNTLTVTDCYEPYNGGQLYQAYYKFTIGTSLPVTISNCGSVNSGYYLNLYDVSGNLMASASMGGPSCPNSAQASMTQSLVAGTYYIGVPGYLNSNPITTTISAQLANCTLLAASPSSDQNYISTYIPTVPINSTVTFSFAGVCQSNQAVQYFDGIGRLIQTVQVKSSYQGNDIVQPVAYDAYARESKKYLPYTIPSTGISDGSYKNNALADQASYYNPSAPGAVNISTTSFPVSQLNYEYSPLNRITEEGAPGDNWQPLGTANTLNSGHTVKYSYGSNDAADLFTGQWILGETIQYWL